MKAVKKTLATIGTIADVINDTVTIAGESVTAGAVLVHDSIKYAQGALNEAFDEDFAGQTYVDDRGLRQFYKTPSTHCRHCGALIGQCEHTQPKS